jgi:hypothetical protein
MITNPTRGILSSFSQLEIPSTKLSKPKGNGMMNRKSNFTNVKDNQPKPPALVAKEIQMYIRGKNRKYTNETA